MSQGHSSPLYANSGSLPFASQLSSRARRNIYTRFVATMSPCQDEIILDVGVTSDNKFPESNFFERMYPYKDRITCVGTEDGSYLRREYPGIRFTRVGQDQPLPFPMQHFDIAFSNAVIEHVGNRDQQRAFLAEVLRVSKRFFLTTPNRWFPFEVHTGLPLLHFLPPNLYRAMLRHTRFCFWAREESLNLLTVQQFRSLFPTGAQFTIELGGINLFSFKSNLLAYGLSGEYV